MCSQAAGMTWEVPLSSVPPSWCAATPCPCPAPGGHVRVGSVSARELCLYMRFGLRGRCRQRLCWHMQAGSRKEPAGWEKSRLLPGAARRNTPCTVSRKQFQREELDRGLLPGLAALSTAQFRGHQPNTRGWFIHHSRGWWAADASGG